MAAAGSPQSEFGTPDQRVAEPFNTSPEPATPLGVRRVGRYQRCIAVARPQHLTVSHSQREYAKVKVPAHAECNSGFASAYENQVKSHLDDLDELFQNLVAEEVGTLIDYGPDDSA